VSFFASPSAVIPFDNLRRRVGPPRAGHFGLGAHVDVTGARILALLPVGDPDGLCRSIDPGDGDRLRAPFVCPADENLAMPNRRVENKGEVVSVDSRESTATTP
jgi:hypothetical protein